MLNSIPMSWLYILTVCIKLSNSFSFLVNSLMSSMYIRWIIFSGNFVNCYRIVHFLSMWLSGIIAITNSNGDSASPWKIPLWIFTTAKLFSPVVNYTLQISIVISINLMTLPDILYILRQSITQFSGTIWYAFLWLIHATPTFSVSFYCRWGYVEQYIVAILFIWFPCGIHSVLRGTDRSLLSTKSR